MGLSKWERGVGVLIRTGWGYSGLVETARLWFWGWIQRLGVNWGLSLHSWKSWGLFGKLLSWIVSANAGRGWVLRLVDVAARCGFSSASVVSVWQCSVLMHASVLDSVSSPHWTSCPLSHCLHGQLLRQAFLTGGCVARFTPSEVWVLFSSGLIAGYTSLYCALLYRASQILCFLQIGGLRQPSVKQALQRHFPSSVCSLQVSVSHFGTSPNISNLFIIIIFVINIKLLTDEELLLMDEQSDFLRWNLLVKMLWRLLKWQQRF